MNATRFASAVLLSVLLAASVAGAGAQATRLASADPQATVVEGHARFTVLTPQLIRMEWSADGRFEDHASLVFLDRKTPVPAFTHAVAGSGAARALVIRTSALELRYLPARVAEGKLTAADLSVTLTLNGRQTVWHPGDPETGNLMGTAKTLDGARGGQTKSPMGPGILSRDGWTVVDDSTRPLFDSDDFSFKGGEQSEWPWVISRPAGDRQDLYFFGYGHDYRKALGDFVQVAGRIPLPPRFVFGAWWSRYWSYSDQELDTLVDGFKANDIPLDVLVIDMGWHPTFGGKRDVLDQAGERKGWTGYTWNNLLFPDPEKFLDHVHAEGLKTTLNLHPKAGVQPWEKPYAAMATAMGIDPATKKYVPFDITNKKFAVNYMDLLHHPLEHQGIDFWWLDWQSEDGTPIAGLTPTWWLNYVHFTDQQREGKRPLLFHRWGGLGNHRYQIGFSGDTASIWDSLAFQPYFTATAANVGYAYWSHDIGGHMPGAVAPELYTRWVQFGAFSPVLRTHTTQNPDAERRIWANPEPYADVMRDAFQLRYALQPYLYTEGRRTYDTGVAFLHPLYYDWPEAPEAYTAKGEYVFGDSMIVAPVTHEVDAKTQLAAEPVWLPPGEWIEWFTGKHITGPATVERSFSIAQIPVYVRGGAIVPMMPKMEYTGQKPIDPLIANVFPMADGEQSSYRVYEDSGEAEDYKASGFSFTELAASRAGLDMVITMKPPVGSFAGMLSARGFEVRLPGDLPPVTVSVDGAVMPYEAQVGKPGWRYDGNTLTTIVTVATRPVATALTVTVSRARQLPALAADGFAGRMTRFREAADLVDHAGLGTYAPDSLLLVEQTGQRLSYSPDTSAVELSALSGRAAAALTDVESLLAEARQGALPARGPLDKPSVHSAEELAHRSLSLERAVALLRASDGVR